MMLTEDDIRRALQVEALDAPELIEVRPAIGGRTSARAQSAHQHRSPRPLIAAVAGAVAVAAVVLIGVVLADSSGPGSDGRHSVATGASSGFDMTYSYSVKPVTGLVVLERDLYPTRQAVIFSAPSTTAVTTNAPVTMNAFQETARVDAYSAGAYDPGPAQRSGTEVSVNGRPGYYADVRVQLHDGVADSAATVPAVVWQYAANSWAVAAGMDASRQDQASELALASAIVPGANPVLLPARLTTLPAGLVRDGVHINLSPPATGISALYSQSSVSVGFKFPSTPSGAADDYLISMTVVSAQIQAAQAGNPTPLATASTAPTASSTDFVPTSTFTAGGTVYTISTLHLSDGNTMSVRAPTSRLSLSIEWTDQLSRTPDLRWADFEPAASMDDQSTWFDAATAIP